jgi:hypothetical protein
MRTLILMASSLAILLSITSCAGKCSAEHVSLTMLSADPSLLLPGNNQTIGVKITDPATSDAVHVTTVFEAPGYNVPGVPPTIAAYSFPSGRLVSGGINDTVIAWDFGAVVPNRNVIYYVTVTAPPAIGAFGLDAKASITVSAASSGGCSPNATFAVVLKDPTSGGE